MHAKQKGNCGELAVALDLAKQGHAVFTELGDLSKTDLIALVGTHPIKIQVKAHNIDKRSRTINLSTKKDGPNYSYKYTVEDVDIFAVFLIEENKVIYVSSKELLSYSRQMSFRLDSLDYGKDSRAHYINDYFSFDCALKKQFD